MEYLSFDWSTLLSDFLKLLTAFGLALPVAWERERTTRIMGLRTFPLVAVASCAYILVALAVLGTGAGVQARILQGLMTGIGFIGGGAILKESSGVSGTATASSIWAIGIVGVAVAYGRYEIALLVSAANFLVLRLMTPLKEEVSEAEHGRIVSPSDPPSEGQK